MSRHDWEWFASPPPEDEDTRQAADAEHELEILHRRAREDAALAHARLYQTELLRLLSLSQHRKLQ